LVTRVDARPHSSSGQPVPFATSQRRRVTFSGHVQGVGFRYTTMNVALQFDVRGYVRNMPDGRVEVVVEGAPSEVDAFINAVKDRMGSFIRKVDSSDAPAMGEFGEFSIRH
jgi:acylphosphatase